MTTKRKLSSQLLSASCALLGTSAVMAEGPQTEPTWTFDTALLYYGESDNRVQDASLNILARHAFIDDKTLTLKLSVDTLTGASASGATSLDRPQTFTSPSGSAVYSTAAGSVPLDDTFLDTRVALSANWSQPLGRNYEFGAGVSASNEYDYFHAGLNASLSRFFNKKNTTVSAGFALAMDDWEPVGGTPVGLSQMLEVDKQTNKRGDDSKDILDVLLGVTQVIDRNTVVQLNYSYSDASGYLNDPYKILSVVDATSGDTLLFTPPPGSAGPDGVYRYENRPDARTRHALFGRVKRNIGDSVLDLSYRFATDDWGIDSHTLDGRYRFNFGASSYLEPHLRFYTQSEADFYRSSLVDGQALPQFASADFRLGSFDAITAGAEYGRKLESGNSWSVRLEYYQQTGDVPGDQIIGNQVNQEQYPDLSAVIAQFSYKFRL